MSLRKRLVLGLVALALVALAVADVATYASLRSFLLDRTDRSLTSASRAVEGSAGERQHVDFRGLADSLPGVYVQIRDPDDGDVLFTGRPPRPPGAEQLPPPELPGQIALAAEGDSLDRVRYFTAKAVDGDVRYRVRASIDRTRSFVIVVGASLEDVDDTLHRLLLVELLVTGAVLLAIAGLGLWVVRVGLRPLDAIGETADAIAAGDLSRRVERAEERTEVGRLGLALNAMLGQIESAFRAREASEARLRRFVADASHELRTPLTAVRAYAELFDRAGLDADDLERAMSGIGRESERMTVLVEDLLLLARLDEGRPLERRPVELERIAAEAVETARTVDPERSLELDAEPAVVLGDRNRLRQIFDNLLANVRAHTPPGTPARLTVSRADGTATVELHDDGPGLAPEQADRVFDRFYRADASRTRASGGVGLGLSIVAAVAQAHGGTVAVRSAPGEGTTFVVTFPLLTESA
jgi:two-component system OmpR family sensor kinase